MLTEGKLHGLYTIGKAQEREKTYYYPNEPLYQMKWVFFIRQKDRGKLKFESLDNLKGKKIGLVTGYKYTPALWAFVKKEGNYEEVSREVLNIRKLAAGRIDYTVSGHAAGIYHAKGLGVKGKILALTDVPLEEIPVYIAFSKKSVTNDFVEKFSNTLKEFKTLKGYQEILNKYLGN